MNDNPLVKKRWFLYLTEFFSGLCVMGVELGASRLLAPYFSSSQIVWTIIIGAIMVAMAIGNFLGGKMADKHKDVSRLYFMIMIASVWICLIPFVGRYVIALVSALLALFVNHGLLIWASFIVCFFLFVPPLLVLGMVTPSLIKYSMGEGQVTSGKVVGILEALNTVGSILGTFLPTFLTIPTIGTTWSFFLFGGILLAICLAYFIAGFIKPKTPKPAEGESVPVVDPIEEKKLKKVKIKRIVAVSLCTAGAVVSGVFSGRSQFDFWDSNVVYQGESVYNYLKVTTDSSKTAYYFSTNVMFGVQSMIKTDKSLTGMYYDKCLAAPLMSKAAEKGSAKMLVLGNGTGTFATESKWFLPFESDITGVEIDQKIIDLSSQYFMMPSDVKTVCDDGRTYLAADKNSYDVIMVDAYSSISVPFQMATVEFFASVKNHLAEGGVMVVNINMASDEKNSIDAALSDTIAYLFPNVYTYRQIGGTNRELFASLNPEMMANLQKNLPSVVSSALRSSLTNTDFVSYARGNTLLTDDNANVELLSMGAVDEIIVAELGTYRAIYQEKGFAGLLDYILQQ